MKRVLLLAIALQWTTAASAETFAIQAGRLIVDAAKPALGPSTVIVENGRIVRVEPGATAPGGATVVDLKASTLLPGLIDAHVHLTGDPGTPFWREAIDTPELATVTGVKNALLTVRAGFTTVRDLGAPGNSSFALRDAIRDGMVPGPRILASGGALSIVGGHGDVSGFRPEVNAALDPGGTCSGSDQCSLRVREWAKRGSDVIKITQPAGYSVSRGVASRVILTRPRSVQSPIPRTGLGSRLRHMPMALAGSRTLLWVASIPSITAPSPMQLR